MLAYGAAGVAAAGIIVADPHRRRWFVPPCPVKLATGLDCPACGGLRMAHDVLHGDLRAAARDNAFMLLCGPMLTLLAARSRASPGGAAAVPPRVAYGLAGAGLLWMAVRNVPGWPLRPARRD
ncbi:MAG: DUF2752 domain-containing protein [Candidatus Dormibacteria bacterium]